MPGIPVDTAHVALGSDHDHADADDDDDDDNDDDDYDDDVEGGRVWKQRGAQFKRWEVFSAPPPFHPCAQQVGFLDFHHNQ